MAETVLRKRQLEAAEGRFPERRQPSTTFFDELAEDRDGTSIEKLSRQL
jgi:hypothetical protein